MNKNFENFIATNPVSKTLLHNQDARSAFETLKNPDNVFNMMTFSEVGLPALSGLGKLLETKFSGSLFDMQDENNRKVIGRMIKFILSEYGYEPIDVPSSAKKLRNFSQTQKFKTCAVYGKIKHAEYQIITVAEKVG